MSKVFNKFKLWDDESIWELATESCCSDLLVASQCFGIRVLSTPRDEYIYIITLGIYYLRTDALAHFILATPKDRLCDSLSCAEAWNYLRDAILLILSHHFLGEDEPLALIVSQAICDALLLLLRGSQTAGKL